MNTIASKASDNQGDNDNIEFDDGEIAQENTNAKYINIQEQAPTEDESNIDEEEEGREDPN